MGGGGVEDRQFERFTPCFCLELFSSSGDFGGWEGGLVSRLMSDRCSRLPLF